jgi:hypothetical protein
MQIPHNLTLSQWHPLFQAQDAPIATTTSQYLSALPKPFFARPAEQVAPELIGCLLVKRQPDGELLWGVFVETEAYSQAEPACHGHRRRSPSNETLFVEPGRFYVYVSYGIHNRVKRLASRFSKCPQQPLPQPLKPSEPLLDPIPAHSHPLHPTPAAPVDLLQLPKQPLRDPQLRSLPETIHLSGAVSRQQR